MILSIVLDLVENGIGCRGIPGIKVTVYLPPNLVGLKMSWVTVAMARERVYVSQAAPLFCEDGELGIARTSGGHGGTGSPSGDGLCAPQERLSRVST